MKKKRVLWVTEAHFTASGFGQYAKQVLTRLHGREEYEIAEFAAYCKPGDGRIHKECQWPLYAIAPSDGDEYAKKMYDSNPNNQFGAYRFEPVLLDFKPDIVISYRDPWMDSFISRSPLRDHFTWAWMPTVDSAPQQDEWIDLFTNHVDDTFAYSEYGRDVLKSFVNNFVDVASPAVDPNVNVILERNKIRAEMGLEEDINIVGTVMRNQKRKLYPELMRAFRTFLDNADPELAAKTYLYIHTVYPEKSGWEIPELITRFGLGSKVLCTYICRQCRHVFPSYFQDSLTMCPKCGGGAGMPGVGFGATEQEMVKIMNLFDLYVQYANCEGFGMPAVEAAGCGVPVAAVDYSAMSDVVRHVNGYPIKVKAFAHEIEIRADRAIPDNDHLASIIEDVVSRPLFFRTTQRNQVRDACFRRYSWDGTAKIWHNYIVNRDISGNLPWDAPEKFYSEDYLKNIPEGLNNTQFIEYVFSQYYDRQQTYGREAAELLRALNVGLFHRFNHVENFSREKIVTNLMNRLVNRNNIEACRVGKQHFSGNMDFIHAKEAHIQ